MGLVVTGISQDGNIKKLEDALKAAGFSLEPIQLIGPDDSDKNLTDVTSEGHIDTELMTGGTGQGTGVPGISSHGSASLSELVQNRPGYFRNEALSDRLGDFEINDSEIDNYLEALEAGRSVVAYFAKPNDVARVEEIFRASGVAKVKTF